MAPFTTPTQDTDATFVDASQDMSTMSGALSTPPAASSHPTSDTTQAAGDTGWDDDLSEALKAVTRDDQTMTDSQDSSSATTSSSTKRKRED